MALPLSGGRAREVGFALTSTMEIEVIARMQDTNLLHYIDGLYGYAIALTRNQADAEDLVQETYVRAKQAMQKLRADSNIKG